MWKAVVLALFAACSHASAPSPVHPPKPERAPLVIGETLRIDSKILGETRTVNVSLPPDYATKPTERFDLLVMLDGGVQEDFRHITGLVDVSTRNGVITPLLVVGIENTVRRRDLVGPTVVPEEQKLAPQAGGNTKFRAFIGEELLPFIAAHYRITNKRAFIGESAAGLFVFETLVTEPAMFDTYIAVTPSVWWNQQAVVKLARERFANWTGGARRLFVATASDEKDNGVDVIFEQLRAAPPKELAAQWVPFPNEFHATTFPLAANRALRTLFPAPPAPP